MQEGQIDWTLCAQVERVEGRRSGEPTIVGTRVPPEAIVGNYRSGMSLEEVAENYPSVSMPVIRALIQFADVQEMKPAA